MALFVSFLILLWFFLPRICSCKLENQAVKFAFSLGLDLLGFVNWLKMCKIRVFQIERFIFLFFIFFKLNFFVEQWGFGEFV